MPKPWACALCHLAPPDVARSRKALREGCAEPFSLVEGAGKVCAHCVRPGKRLQGQRVVMRTIHINDNRLSRVVPPTAERARCTQSLTKQTTKARRLRRARMCIASLKRG